MPADLTAGIIERTLTVGGKRRLCRICRPNENRDWRVAWLILNFDLLPDEARKLREMYGGRNVL